MMRSLPRMEQDWDLALSGLEGDPIQPKIRCAPAFDAVSRLPSTGTRLLENTFNFG